MPERSVASRSGMPFLAETYSRQSKVSLPREWRERLAAFTQGPVDAPGPLSWFLVLSPQRVDRQIEIPDEGLMLYQTIAWCEQLPAGSFDMRVSPKWVTAHNGHVDFALEVTAEQDRRVLARSGMVFRAPGEARTWGEERLPPMPRPDVGRRRRSFVLSEHHANTLLELVEGSHRLIGDATFARQHGLPNVILPAPVLAGVLLFFAGPRSPCSAEVWFRHPVPAGAALEAWASDEPGSGTAFWTLRLVGSGTAAAAVRFGQAATFETSDP